MIEALKTEFPDEYRSPPQGARAPDSHHVVLFAGKRNAGLSSTIKNHNQFRKEKSLNSK